MTLTEKQRRILRAVDALTVTFEEWRSALADADPLILAYLRHHGMVSRNSELGDPEWRLADAGRAALAASDRTAEQSREVQR